MFWTIMVEYGIPICGVLFAFVCGMSWVIIESATRNDGEKLEPYEDFIAKNDDIKRATLIKRFPNDKEVAAYGC